jgi:hypothetical protein
VRSLSGRRPLSRPTSAKLGKRGLSWLGVTANTLKNRSALGASLRLIAIRTGQITRLTMFDEAGLREAARQKFEEALAQRQMDHASALASCRF